MPEGRTVDYAIWRACERFGIRPPDVLPSFDDCNVVVQAMLISYDQVRQIEEARRDVDLAKLGVRM